MSSVNLRDVLHLLASDKVKERQEGITKIRETFQRAHALRSLDQSANPEQAWLSVFQGVFKCVVSERDALRKKKDSDEDTAGSRRLRDAAALVRMLAEKTCQRINATVLGPLVKHLQDAVKKDKDTLLKPVALDYAKTLKCLYSYPPHLARIKPDVWIDLVSLSFGVVSNESLSLALDEELDEDEDEVEHSEQPVSDDIDIDPSATGRGGTPKRSRPKHADPPRKRPRRKQTSLSTEQIEFMGLIHLLMRAPPAPLLGQPVLTHNILNQFYNFFTSHGMDTLAHHDAVTALNYVLQRLDLNARDELTRFGLKMWDPLLSLWGTKNKGMKDEIVIALRLLFPYVTRSTEDSVSFQGLRKLQKLLDGEADSRAASELSLDNLRLELSISDQYNVFETHCFRYGCQFDSPHALTWAILDLHASCVAKLLQLSESPPLTVKGTQAGRLLMHNPLITLLGAIASSTNHHSRTYRLQTLAFVIDRYWSLFSDTLRHDVFDKLTQYLAYEDPSAQSWVFICMSEIAAVDSSEPGTTNAMWENVWVHSTRRLSSPNVSRAACLVAQAIVLQKKIPSHRVLADIENLGRDLDVQGPPYPYDSVCAFIGLCLRLASQDMRLYRLQLEDKVFSWLVDGFHADGGGGRNRARMPANTVTDILMLLELVCGLPKRSDLFCRRDLPDCVIVSAMITERDTLQIRDYLLHARVPAYRPSVKRPSSGGNINGTSSGVLQGSDPEEPSPRERRTSSFLLRCLETSLQECESLVESNSPPTVFRVRRCIDLAVIAITFEASLSLNGKTANRRVLQSAAKLLCAVAPSLCERRWNVVERAFILLGLEPLVSVGDEADNRIEILLPPGPHTGIKYNTHIGTKDDRKTGLYTSRRQLQTIISQFSDTQDAFTAVSTSLRTIMTMLAGQGLPQASTDDRDGFGSFRSNNAEAVSFAKTESKALKVVVDVSTMFLVVTPTLLSSNDQPTRDKSLTEILLNSSPENFVLLAPAYFDNVRQGNLNLSVIALANFLDKYADFMQLYPYAREEATLLTMVHTMSSSAAIWLPETMKGTENGAKVHQLVIHLCDFYRNGYMYSWRVRNACFQFLDQCISLDPIQESWLVEVPNPDNGEVLLKQRPNLLEVIPTGGADEDIRVRVTAAIATAHLFSVPHSLWVLLPGASSMKIGMMAYEIVKSHLSTNLKDFEGMMSRLLCLGNIMIVSSAVRRGPYWHLLETSFFADQYNRHLEVLLRGVSDRMGLTCFSELFVTHASQIGYSLRVQGKDFLRLPPQLLGFKERREAAESVFRPLSLVNLLSIKREGELSGRTLFENHCRTVHKATTDGLRECFADAAGSHMVSWIDRQMNGGMDVVQLSQEVSHDLREYLDALAAQMGNGETFAGFAQRSAPEIAVAVLRCLGDLHHSSKGPLLSALEKYDDTGKASTTFKTLVEYRAEDNGTMHEPNSPSYSTATVLGALHWLRENAFQAFESASIYHVLYSLFSETFRTPIVNEQIRLLNAICLWTSLTESEFKDTILLRTFVSGTLVFLEQPSLALAAQSMLGWVLKAYKTLRVKESKDLRLPEFPDQLIRIASVASSLSSKDEEDIATLGRQMMNWFENAVADLVSANHKLQEHVAQALAAWPRSPNKRLALLAETLPLVSVSRFFKDKDPTSPSTQFRLVHKLLHGPPSMQLSRDRFAQEAFWSLKGCIPDRDSSNVQDVAAFAALLVQNAGRVDNFGRNKPEASYLRGRHVHYGAKLKSVSAHDWVDTISPPKRSIILELLSLLHSNEWSRGYMAYGTLRSLLSVTSVNNLVTHSWGSDSRTELVYLHRFTEIARSRQDKDLVDTLQSEPFSTMATDFSTWIAALDGLLCDVLNAWDPFYGQLHKLIESDTAFATDVLPVLVHTLLWACEAHPEASQQSNLPPWKDILSGYLNRIVTVEKVDSRSVQAVLGVVLHLRNFRLSDSDGLSHDKWLVVDYRKMSQAAITCGAYTTALLCLELSLEYQSEEPFDVQTAENILFDIYRHIGEPDGFYGIQTSNWRQFLLRRFHHERQWDKAFQFHGATLETGNQDSAHLSGILQSLHAFGFDKLAINILRHPPGPLADEASVEMSYRLGWRSEVWDLPEQTSAGGSEAPLYSALRAVYRDREGARLSSTLHAALLNQAESLRSLGDENLVQIRQVTRSLMCLAQVAFWTESPEIQNSLRLKRVDFEAWESICDAEADLDFGDLENIMATRIALIRSARHREERELLGHLKTPYWRELVSTERTYLLRLSKASRHSRELQVALNSATRAQELAQPLSFDVIEEYASVLWDQKEQKLAIQVLAEAVKANQPSMMGDDATAIKRATLLARLGAWTAEARLERPAPIHDQYFEPAVQLIEGLPASATQVSIFRQYATFAERQYQAIVKSPDVIRLKVLIERKRKEIEQRQKSQPQRSQRSQDPDENRKQIANDTNELRKARLLLEEDESKLTDQTEARSKFLNLALDMLSRCLGASDEDDINEATRFVSLWFIKENFDNPAMVAPIQAALNRIPTRKFVFLAHQLSARLSQREGQKVDAMQGGLHSLVQQLCREHPFQCLPQVFCVKDESTKKGKGLETEPGVGSPEPSTRRSGRFEDMEPPSVQAQRDRAYAARLIFSALIADPSVGSRVRAVDNVCRAALHFAEMVSSSMPGFTEEKKKKGLPMDLPQTIPLGKLKAVDVPVLTMHLPPDPTLKYDNCVWIETYERKYVFANGINVPKVISCVGSDGRSYKQLFKGERADDLRQDAVMKQVFELVNLALGRDRETRKRELIIRTYKIIPLASKAGLLEFVSDTVPMRNWLTLAHRRYRPQDMAPQDCQETLARAVTQNLMHQRQHRVQKLVPVYKNIRTKFRPVMRHYFTEQSKVPTVWFSKRLAYARSVATTSIVGHILGVGDRHTSNILLSNSTGEVIHIDFGIAFDQGRLLPIPERVPFRMTEDMIDGLGLTGTQGVFQRCAQEALRVLRDDSEIIMSVLEVLKYDPLHSWTASEVKLKNVQGKAATSGAANDVLAGTVVRFGGLNIDLDSAVADEAAERALNSVSRKLDKGLTVEYVVNDLLAEATDVVNLATIFHGWGPHF